MSFLNRLRLGRTRRTRPPEDERRRACRSRAVVRDVVFGCEPGGTREDVPASLEDVSIDGCMAKSRSMPLAKPGDPIWFGLAGSHPAERIEGTLIDARKSRRGECSVRIKFVSPLPYATFKHLVYGPQGPGQRSSIYRECESDRFWK